MTAAHHEPVDDEVPTLNRPVLIAAFAGWSDAADVATATVDHLIEQWDAEVFAELDGEEHYNFQEARPEIGLDEHGVRTLTWPTPTLYLARSRAGDRDVLLLRGVEPHLRWNSMANTIVGLAKLAGVEELITLGALLTDVPHSRPTPVSGSTNDPIMLERLGLPQSTYVGPVGFTTVLSHTASAHQIATASLWAAIPHYLSDPPFPKGTMALLGSLEDVLGVSLPHGVLKELAEAWQRGVEELLEADEDLADYVEALEKEADERQIPDVSGDSIAREFERYLRRRNSGES